MRNVFVLAMLALATLTMRAQWDIQDAHVTADLRGIHYVGHGVAWASGTNGTVLRTEDMGFVWQLCAVPPGAEKLDFRGVQAFDNNTAIVMSSGKGDLSRLYKTTDGCQTWKLVFTNPDQEGFFDAFRFVDQTHGYLLGDPVGGSFRVWETSNGGSYWPQYLGGVPASQGEAAFAASNSALSLKPPADEGNSGALFVTGGGPHARVLWMQLVGRGDVFSANWKGTLAPIVAGTSSAGIFSVAFRDKKHGVCVGGNYQKPSQAMKTATYTNNGTEHWQIPASFPHGYRSSVAFDTNKKVWITVGPNGTDISTDDGRNWRALKPAPGQPPDADQHWNALSLPFVVGPKGRIGILRDDALKVVAK